MPRFIDTPEDRYRHDAPARVGVLLTNLGTPDAATAGAVRKYLGEFLADPRVVELPRVLWRLILHGFVLRARPRRSAAAYRQIWTDEGSPLLATAGRQAAAVRAGLEGGVGGEVEGEAGAEAGASAAAAIKVALGMRYGNPAIAAGLEELRRGGCDRLLVLPLYPQYSASTGGATFDAVAAVLKKWRWVPQLRMVMGYHREAAWLDAVAASVREHWDEHGRGQVLLFSFHGLPRRFLSRGDPYHCQCHASARLVAERLELAGDQWQVVFQSRFGRAEWLQPYCDKTLAELPGRGVKSVDIVCPGFAADCLETLYEIDRENRAIFHAAGGERYCYIPALNDRPRHIAALVGLIEKNLAGWDLPAATPGELSQTRQRALALGAAQ